MVFIYGLPHDCFPHFNELTDRPWINLLSPGYLMIGFCVLLDTMSKVADFAPIDASTRKFFDVSDPDDRVLH